MMKLVLSFLLLSCLLGCTVTQQSAGPTGAKLPEFYVGFGRKPALPTLSDIYQLGAEQEQAFLQYFNKPENRNIEPHYRVYAYLNELLGNFSYAGETYTAAQTLALNRGNCLSLAVLTTALANLAEVEIDYQLIDSDPVFELKGSIINKGVHVSSLIYLPNNEQRSIIKLRTGGLRIDYFPSERDRFIGNISDDEYVAMYYRNIAGEAIAVENYSLAYWLTLESMQYSAWSADALNMMAIIHRRIGELAKSEEIYLYGIEYAQNKLTLLKNYHLLLMTQGRVEEARLIELELDTIDDPSPFHWFYLARDAYQAADYNNAIVFYNKAIALASYLHEAYVGVAQSYYALGQANKAEKFMRLAIEKADQPATISLYEAKLATLKK